MCRLFRLVVVDCAVSLHLFTPVEGLGLPVQFSSSVDRAYLGRKSYPSSSSWFALGVSCPIGYLTGAGRRS